MIINEELSNEVQKINEMFITIKPSLDPRVTNSVYYPKLKHLMFSEIVEYCKEKIELRQDLLNLRTYIGDYVSEFDIRTNFDKLKDKYKEIQDIGLDYHIETTRVDYGVCMFCIIKRGDNIYCKKFIFRFRKTPDIGLDMSGIASGGSLLPDIKQDIVNIGGEDNV